MNNISNWNPTPEQERTLLATAGAKMMLLDKPYIEPEVELGALVSLILLDPYLHEFMRRHEGIGGG